MIRDEDIKEAVLTLKRGGVIAYPTEAVYGLGCDPFDADAVAKILYLKQRVNSKGLILIAATWDQIKSLLATEAIAPDVLAKIRATWPGPVTWIFPATKKVPVWIRGEHDSVAVRVSAHPTVQALCKSYGGAIVSTSANLAGQIPARTEMELQQQFPKGIDYVVPGELGSMDKPTPIYDAVTGEVVR